MPHSNVTDYQTIVTPLTSASAIPLTANMLRALAEEADGLRGVDASLVLDPASPNAPLKVVKGNPVGGQVLVSRLLTNTEPEFAPREFALTPEPLVVLANTKDDFSKCDAIFLTAAAVDKFVVPYYARMRDLADVRDSRNAFMSNPNNLAVVHLPDSVDDTLRAAGPIYMLRATAPADSGSQKAELLPFL